MSVDLRTLTLVLILASLLQAIAIHMQARTLAAGSRLAWWTIGNLLYALGFLSVALRDRAGLEAAMILANNLLFMVGNTFFFIGILRFLGRKIPVRTLGLGISSAFLLILFFTFAADVIAARRMVLSAYGIGLAFGSAWVLWSARSRPIRRSVQYLVVVYILYGATLLVRLLAPILGESLSGGVFAPSRVETLRFFSILASGVLLNFGLIILINQQLQAESQESRLMLQTVLDTIPVRVFWKDRHLRYLGCNRAFAKDAGLQDPAEVVGRDDFELWPRFAEDYRTIDHQVLGSGQPQLGYENALVRPDGTLAWTHNSKVPLRAPDGQIHGVLGTYEDITAQRMVDQEMRTSQARLQAVFESAGAAISMTDSQGHFLEFNPKWSDFLGYTREELQTCTNLDITHPDDLEASRRNWVALFEGRVPAYLQEKRYLRKDGQIVWGLLTVTPIRDEQGVIRNVIGIVTDITERKRMEAELAAVSQRLALATQGAGVGIWEWDPVRDETYWDDTIYRLLGISREAAANPRQAWERALLPEDLVRCDAENRAALNDKDYFESVFRVRWPDTSLHYIRSAAKILRDGSGTPLRMIGINFDITGQKQAEEALRRYMIRLQTILSSLPEGIVVLNQTGVVELVNERLCEIFDVEENPVTLTGLTSAAFRERLNEHLVDPEAYNSRVEELLAAKKPFYDEEFLLKSGKIVRRDFVPILVDGEMTGRMWTHRDITALRRSEEKQRMDENRIRSLMLLHESSSLPEKGLIDMGIEEMARLSGSTIAYLHFVNTDQETLELVAWNAEALKDCTASKDDHYPLSRAGVWADCFRLRKPVIHNDYQNLPERKGYPEGHTHLVRHLSVPIFEGVSVVAIAGVGNKATDYTEEDAQQLGLFMGGLWNLLRRKRAEQRLVESEHFLKTVADAMPGMVGYWDRNLRCTFANIKYLEWFGRTPEQMLGLRMEELLGEERFNRNAPFVWKVLAGEPQHFERTLVKADGTTGDTWAHYIPDKVGDEVRGFFVLVSDVTELKQAQLQLEALNQDLETRTREAESANRAKSAFLANMSHEIRTPMNAIMGLSHLALRTELTARQRDYLTRIQAASRTLLGLINDILDLSRIEADKLEMERAPFDLREVLEHTLDLVSVRAREKGLRVDLDLDGDVPPKLVGDSLRVGQVLLNLMNNAVKFTERGHVLLTVRLAGHEGLQAHLRFEVQDTGIGIPEEVLPRLFQSFTQADSSTTRRYGGSGLGLAICKRLVELMGGQIVVRSSPGTGSTFSFELPLECQPGCPASEAPRFSAAARGHRALVVDNDATSRETLAEMIATLGLTPETAPSGLDGIEALVEAQRRGAPFDLVLLDWRMPDMDGLETAQCIRQDPRLHPKPLVILVTAYGRDEIDRRADELAFDGILLKPVSMSLLWDTLSEALSRRGSTPTRQPKDKPLSPMGVPGRGKILLAEDNETNRLVAQELLEGAGYEVACARDGREAVIMALDPQARYELILMDVQMPEMDGFEAAARIREKRRDLPILAMTAHAMEAERRRCLEAGMDDHIPKPVQPGDLLRRVERWISEGRRRQLEGNAPDPGPPRPSARLLEAAQRDLSIHLAALSVALASEQPDLARRAAHALKGLPEGLLQPGLRSEALALEGTLLDGGPWQERARSLERAAQAALADLSVRAPLEGGGTERDSGGEVDMDRVRSLLDVLEPLLRRKSLSARKTVEKLATLAGDTVHMRSLVACMNRMDFPGAVEALKQLRHAYPGLAGDGR